MPTKELREYARRLAKKKGIKKENPLKVLDKIREDNGGKSMKIHLRGNKDKFQSSSNNPKTSKKFISQPLNCILLSLPL